MRTVKHNIRAEHEYRGEAAGIEAACEMAVDVLQDLAVKSGPFQFRGFTVRPAGPKAEDGVVWRVEAAVEERELTVEIEADGSEAKAAAKAASKYGDGKPRTAQHAGISPADINRALS